MKERLLSAFLALCLCVMPLPVAVWAEDTMLTSDTTDTADPADPAEPTVAETAAYADAQEVSDYDGLAGLLPSTPDPNPIPVAKLAGNITVGDGQSIGTMGKIIIPSGCTLTIESGGYVEAEIGIGSGGAIKVESGGILATTQAGENAINNAGEINIAAGGELWSQKGGHVNNTGTLKIDGVFHCGSAAYGNGTASSVPWFENSGTVNGSGQVVVFNGNGADLNAVTGTMKTRLGNDAIGKGKLSVYTQAESYSDLATLNSASNVDGMFVSTRGFARVSSNSVEITGDLSTGKNLWIDNIDVPINSGATLTISSLDNLKFNRMGRIGVEAQGTPGSNQANGGGKLVIGTTKLISGSSGDNAHFTPTGGLTFVTAVSYEADSYYPAAPKWLYVGGLDINGTIYTGAASATGDISSLTDNNQLDVIVDETSTLTLTGDLTLRYLELRNKLDLSGYTLTAQDVTFGFDPTGQNLKSEITGTGTFNITNGASVGCDVFIPENVTLNLSYLYSDNYNSSPSKGVLFHHRGRLAVEAGGGTIRAGQAPATLISGSGTDAVLVPTGTWSLNGSTGKSYAFLSAAQYHSDQDWPADWLYLIGDATSCGGTISGLTYRYSQQSDVLQLVVEEGGTLTVPRGKELAVGSLDLRGTLAVSGTVTAADAIYANTSSVTGTFNSTNKFYECVII